MQFWNFHEIQLYTFKSTKLNLLIHNTIDFFVINQKRSVILLNHQDVICYDIKKQCVKIFKKTNLRFKKKTNYTPVKIYT